jgi:4-amino-4-deoxy-L-arabinose transferase-like glycosyltransferase
MSEIREHESGASLQKKNVINFAGAGLLCVGTFLLVFMVWKMFPVQYAGSADEGYYLSYVNALTTNGVKFYPQIYEIYLEDSSHWHFPNPLRLSHYLVTAALATIFSPSFDLLAMVSAISHSLLVGITFLFARRRYSFRISLATAVLLAVSPLALGLGRRALIDSYSMLWGGLSIWCFLDCLRYRESWYKWASFIIVFVIAILAKETNVLLSIVFIAWPIISYGKRLDRKLVTLLGGSLLCAWGLTVLAYILSAGGLSPFLNVVKVIIYSPNSNQYALNFGGGPWFRYIVDFILISPISSLLAIGMGGIILAGKRERENSESLFFLLLIAGLFFAFSFFTKNIRYVGIIVLPISLLAAMFVNELSCRWKGAWQNVFFALIIIAVCTTELVSFKRIFIDYKTYDPVTYRLLLSREMIPRVSGRPAR